MLIQEDGNRGRKNIQKILNGGKLGGVEYTALRKDGSTFTVMIFAAPIIHDNEPVGLMGIVIDILEQKQAEEKLKKSEENYHLIVENANEIIVIAQDGYLKFGNLKAVEITGYSENELLSKPFIEFIYPDDRAMVHDNYLKRLNREKPPDTYSLRIIDRNGNIKWLHNSPILTTWENRPAILTFLIDITEWKKAEMDLHEREKQLNQSQKMEAIGRLTGGITHDFNNILTAVIGFSDFLLMKLNENDFLYSYIKEIKKAGLRASSLINQLLAFSRKQILQPKVLNINTVVSEMEKILRRLIGEDIHLLTNLDPKLGNAKINPSQIEQVIMNVAVNARDTMPSGGNLTIETSNVYLNEEYASHHVSVIQGPYVMFTVSDSGIGMDKETQEHIFEPFFTTKESVKGTGLGLSTVYGIVKQSEGYIWVCSEPGNGTTFKIYFPRILKEVELDQLHKSSIKSPHGTETVLLVEDDGNVRNMVFSVLKTFGYTVLEAKNGEEALRVSNENETRAIDLMITDIVMPGMSGRELADKLLTEKPYMKLLFISGHTENA